MSHTHLTRSDRARLAVLMRTGDYTQIQIAALLGTSASTVSKELSRNSTTNGYNARIASQRTVARRRKANQLHRKLRPGSRLTRRVERGLTQYWSPEQVAGRIALLTAGDEATPTVSHPTIYAYIHHHSHLKKYLRHQKRYRRRYGTKKREKQRELAKKQWIDARPAVINERQRVGDWEGDTVIGDVSTKARLLTYVERKSGKAVALKVAGGPGLANQVADATEQHFTDRRRLPKKKCRSMTYDNGVEFNAHERIQKRTRMTVYFAHPYHSWERGTNENTNGLYRQFYPKKKDLTDVSQKDIDRITKLLNTRPRKRHGYRTPDEVFKDDK